MTEELSIPPVPPECDLKDFAFMPLEFRRLFTSETWMLGNDAAKLAALHLWCESWHQVPASSLPDNDRALSLLSQAGSRWQRVKEHALRGWVKCTDGRLYHPFVAQKALEAWERKLDQRSRTHKARVTGLRKRIEEASTDHEKRLLQDQLQALLQEAVTGSKGQGQLKGQGEGQNPKRKSGSGAAHRPAKSGPAWEAFTEAYLDRYKHPPTRNAVENAAMAAFVELVPLEEAPEIAAFYVRHSKAWYVDHQHSAKYLRQDAAGLRTQWLTGRQVTSTEARQADRTAATGGQVERLLSESRKVA